MEGPLVIYFIGLLPLSCHAFPCDVELFRIRPTALCGAKRLFERQNALQHLSKCFISQLTAKYTLFSYSSADVK